VKVHLGGESVGAFEESARLPGGGGVADDQFDALMPGQIPNDLGVDPRNRLELSRPIIVIVGPSEPRGRVRLPLRGHAVAEGGGFKHWRLFHLGVSESVAEFRAGLRILEASHALAEYETERMKGTENAKKSRQSIVRAAQLPPEK